ncbi:unnamed protein product [Symbiodinium natans]|uniref:Uncharacterized protein n=1 Tax=Symbiodinium natans TaxID=878477 RepID=A0A812K805_9DINO|nr:unnamed protein product [Symbiodinium natans]
MMRIVCPNCGEEPQKGQRHVCKPAGAVDDGPGPPEKSRASMPLRRTVPCATAGSMCASIASLASKNPGLWKSSRTLARCGGEDFVAALIFTAAGLPTWILRRKCVELRRAEQGFQCSVTWRIQYLRLSWGTLTQKTLASKPLKLSLCPRKTLEIVNSLYRPLDLPARSIQGAETPSGR